MRQPFSNAETSPLTFIYSSYKISLIWNEAFLLWEKNHTIATFIRITEYQLVPLCCPIQVTSLPSKVLICLLLLLLLHCFHSKHYYYYLDDKRVVASFGCNIRLMWKTWYPFRRRNIQGGTLPPTPNTRTRYPHMI